MKFTKRMKNAVLQAFIVNIIFLLIFSWVFFFNVYPKAKGFFTKIWDLELLSEDFTKISQEWMRLPDLKKVATKYKLSSDDFTNNVIQSFDPLLFKNNFTNTGTLTYLEFLEGAQQSLNTQKQSQEYIQRDATLNRVLPVYSFESSIWQESLTDFYFINYIEKILYSFNLSSNGTIGVRSLEKIEDNMWEEWSQENSLISENIYSIPVTFWVTWQKQNIVDFIHFLENVWSISLTETGVSEYSDSFITKQIDGEEESENYNIYKNQISVIDSISFAEYPDAWNTESWEDLIETIKVLQSRQKYSVNIEASFFVAWIPSYQIQAYITDFYTRFDQSFENIDNFTKEITQKKNTFQEGIKIESVQKLQSLYMLMISFSDDIKTGRTIVNTWKIDEETFDSYVEYSHKLDRVISSFEELNTIFTQE